MQEMTRAQQANPGRTALPDLRPDLTPRQGSRCAPLR